MPHKYTLLHTGRPYGPCESIPPDAWKAKSYHASEAAAWRAVDKSRAHLTPGSWDDHYRVIAPDGSDCNRDRFYWERYHD